MQILLKKQKWALWISQVLSWVIVLLLSLLYVSEASAQPYMLNNNKFSYGGGGGNNALSGLSLEDSIAGSGMLKQPFYKASNGLWYKLTFYNYPLNLAIGTGTGGGNWSGSTVVDISTMNNMTVTAAPWTELENSAGVSRGYGTIVVQGEITVNGSLLSVRNTYELSQSASYTKITTRLTNISGAQVNNVNMWVGTQDDWIGTSDGPTKTRGSVVNGNFVALTATNQQSNIIKIESGAEGVLFYSLTPGAGTSIDNCCRFSNAYNVNPSTSPITLTGDGSYSMNLPVGNLAPGASVDFSWFYAAGALADLANIIQQVAAAASTLKARTDVSATLEYSVDQTGVVYYMVVPGGSPTPSTAQIKAGAQYGAVVPVFASNANIVANTPKDLFANGLSATTAYSIHVFTEYLVSGSSTASPISSSNFTTRPSAPTITSVTPANQQASIGISLPGGVLASNYQYSLDNGTNWITRTPASVTSPLVITGLTNFTTYNMKFRALNDTDEGMSSDTVVVPIVPADLQASAAIPGGFPSSASAGMVVNGKYRCTNIGAASAANVLCNLTSPTAGVSITSGGCTLNGSGAVVMTPPASYAVLGPNGYLECSASYTQPITNTNVSLVASSSNTFFELALGNNSVTSTVTTLFPDLQASAGVAGGFPSSASAGSVVNGKYRCTNVGVANATNVLCNLTSPTAGVSITSGGCTLNGSGANVSLPYASLSANDYLECSASYVQPITNTNVILFASTSNAVFETITNNNSASMTVNNLYPDLQASAGVVGGFPSSASAGSVVNGKYRCTNVGLANATNVLCSLTSPTSGVVITPLGCTLNGSGAVVMTPPASYASLSLNDYL